MASVVAPIAIYQLLKKVNEFLSAMNYSWVVYLFLLMVYRSRTKKDTICPESTPTTCNGIERKIGKVIINSLFSKK